MRVPHIDTIREQLVLNKHELDKALMIQADVLERIGIKIVELEEEHKRLNTESRRLEAVAFAMRKDQGDSDKVAAERVKAMPPSPVDLDAIAVGRDLAEWRNLYEAWKTRGYSLKELVGLYTAQYFAAEPTHERKSRPDYSEQRESRAAKSRRPVT